MNKLKVFLLLVTISLVVGISACSTTPKQPEQKPQEEKPVTQEAQAPAEEKPAEPIVEEKKPEPRQEEPKSTKASTTVYFAPAAYEIDPLIANQLRAIAKDLKANNVTQIKVVGHSSRLNTRKSEEQISLRRAVAVAQYFQDIGLLTSDEITISAEGANEPAGSHAEITERRNNRRVEILY